MTPVLSALETGLPDAGSFQGTRIHLPLRYLTVQSWCWCLQTFWALHGQQHSLLRGSPEFNNPFTQESSLWFSTGVPKTRMEMVSVDVTSTSYFMTNHLSPTIKEEKMPATETI